MHPSLVASTVSYQNVFQYSTYVSWSFLIPLGGFAVSILIFFILSQRVKAIRSDAAVGMIAVMLCNLLVSVPSVAAGGMYAASFRSAAKSAMIQNVKEKYNVELSSPDEPVNLDQSKSYNLVFPDGSKDTYMIRFDKSTSEPFILSGGGSPTAQELNQKPQKSSSGSGN